MKLLLGLLLGMLASAAQAEWLRVTPLGPDLRVLAISLMLLRLSREFQASMILGFVLGFSAGTLETVSVGLIGSGVTALLLLPTRRVLFVNSRWIQCLGALLTLLAFWGTKLALTIAGIGSAGGLNQVMMMNIALTCAMAPPLHWLVEQSAIAMGRRRWIAPAWRNSFLER